MHREYERLKNEKTLLNEQKMRFWQKLKKKATKNGKTKRSYRFLLERRQKINASL